MPKKKAAENEVDLDVKSPKKETFVTRWFNDYAVNNKDELKIICELTARSAEEQFFMFLDSGNNEVYAVIFYCTFLTILRFLRDKQKKYNNFTIEIGNSINIGYTNNDNEENEKVGNFMPIMEYIGVNHVIVDSEIDFSDNEEIRVKGDETSVNFIRWKNTNLKTTVNYYKDIQEQAYNSLKSDYKVKIRTSEAVIPLFCTFMDNITNVLKEKYREAEGTDVSEISMNVLGLFDVYYSFDEDSNQEVIEFTPNIRMKLALKNDTDASR